MLRKSVTPVVIANGQRPCGDPQARNLSGQGTLDCRVETKVSPRNDNFGAYCVVLKGCDQGQVLSDTLSPKAALSL